MELDEAIAHAKEVAEEKRVEATAIATGKEDYFSKNAKYTDCIKCSKEHQQLVEWLEELKERREAMEHIKKYYILVGKSPKDNPNELIIRKAFGESEDEKNETDN